MKFTLGQLKTLSDLFIDVAKGLFLASVARSALSARVRFISSLLFVIVGLFFVYLSLKAIKLKESYEQS